MANPAAAHGIGDAAGAQRSPKSAGTRSCADAASGARIAPVAMVVMPANRSIVGRVFSPSARRRAIIG